MWISTIYQLKRHPSEIKVSMEFLIGSSEAKAWPIIQVSERQKGREGCLSPSIARKATPTPMNGALSEHQKGCKRLFVAWCHKRSNTKANGQKL